MFTYLHIDKGYRGFASLVFFLYLLLYNCQFWPKNYFVRLQHDQLPNPRCCQYAIMLDLALHFPNLVKIASHLPILCNLSSILSGQCWKCHNNNSLFWNCVNEHIKKLQCECIQNGTQMSYTTLMSSFIKFGAHLLI